MQIAAATTDADILACFPVLKELRPALVAATFLEDVRRMQAGGYRLVAAREAEVLAVAGYRWFEMFAFGPICYVDDLVTAASARSRGCGAALLGWIETEASAHGARYVALDSAHARVDAHRFYRRQGYDDVGLHFVRPLGDAPRWSITKQRR